MTVTGISGSMTGFYGSISDNFGSVTGISSSDRHFFWFYDSHCWLCGKHF
jgi:hypothetical protein